MRLKSGVISLACCAALAAPCHAAEGFTDGEKLLAYCADAESDSPKINPFRAGYCFGFIEGALRGWEAHAMVRNAPLNYCIPAGTSIGVLVSRIAQHVRENPAARAGRAEISVLQAVQRAYPCAQPGK
ncbi:MAG TPA: Rap1a/Tai family immunity protein [Burkholderiales bacterium]|nr:Rap1a/Tai family immunity protein [Burkholderiales bacterium]